MHASTVARAVVTVVVALALGCAESTAPRPGATVDVPSDTLAAAVVRLGSVDHLQFTVPVTIRNNGSAPVRFEYCTSSIEYPDGAAWLPAWAPACFAASSTASLENAPGATGQFELHIDAAVSGPGAPEWRSPQLGGTYRAKVGLSEIGGSGIIPSFPSDAFVLRIGN